MPSAECDREGEARRGEVLGWSGAGLVLKRWCTGPQDRDKAGKDASSNPKMEGPGVARRMRLEMVDRQSVVRSSEVGRSSSA